MVKVEYAHGHKEIVVRPFSWTRKQAFLRTQFFNILLSEPLALELGRCEVAQRRVDALVDVDPIDSVPPCVGEFHVRVGARLVDPWPRLPLFAAFSAATPGSVSVQIPAGKASR